MKTIHLITEIVSELQKLFHHNENKKNYFRDGQKVFSGRKHFFFENVENIGKVKSGS